MEDEFSDDEDEDIAPESLGLWMSLTAGVSRLLPELAWRYW